MIRSLPIPRLSLMVIAEVLFAQYSLQPILTKKLHLDLRIKLAHTLYGLRNERRMCLEALADPSEDQTTNEAVVRYVENLKKRETYASYFELTCLADHLNNGVQIFVTDIEYKGDRLITMKKGAPMMKLFYK
jgi:hypothetical protein